LTPSGRSAARPHGKTTASPVYFFGLAFLVMIAIGVVVFLPESVEVPANLTENVPLSVARDSPSAAVSAQIPKQNGAEDTPAALVKDRLVEKEAKSLLAKVLERQIRLENDGAKIWGDSSRGPGYVDALAALNTANSELDRQEYARASDGFRVTLTMFDQLVASKDERFVQAMNAGMAALDILDGPAATPNFQMALALQPQNGRAQGGLVRATQAPQVLDQMTEGRRHEAAGDIDRALHAFQAATALDPKYVPASENARRLSAIVVERNYENAVSAALAAIKSHKFGQALQALETARKIRPTAPEITELRARIRFGRQQQAIANLRKRALSLEQAEDWSGAIKHYEKALAIDPIAGFAIQGRTRAEKFNTLYGQVRNYIANPDRLSSPALQDHARQVLATARRISNAGPKLQADAKRLDTLISDAETPRPVVLKSDGQTRIVIYRVARLGVLAERRLMLRPGRYVAVGSRSGYRDVRVTFLVPSNDTETVVEVRCVEGI
jgi:tetratricopeptide (TPR) repeat protein